ncbi:UNVERIFIED_CONTAM: hypothetical protein PYX00_002125 [Menopon gallinae]|uniref:Fatty acyl-CoA reductase n=1 Tax=Menopon gallinae TaxID=328185 RepID=A0AAW2IFK0_9NEOP
MGKEAIDVQQTVTNKGGSAECSNFNDSVQEFYSDTKILVTGATGFIGKALVEKLLRSCVNIHTIYLLIRPKKGMSTEVRHAKLLTSSIFDLIRENNQSLLKKLVTIHGDVTEPNLGLSESDRQMLIEEVDVVFHSAATVRFNEKMKDAVTLNTLGTVKVLQLCREMKKLKALVHVSTAYSNADKQEILETVYPTPAQLDDVLKYCEEEECAGGDGKCTKLLGKHPNTYTMTKAMAEYIISNQAGDLPVCIVRPSIVTGSWKEPKPGWVDNISGISGIMIEIGRGTLRSIICDEELIMDVIPVDIVVNTLITAAWQTARHRMKNVQVYNCTSGTINPIKWHEYGRITEKYVLEMPSKYVQWYPGFSFRTNRLVHAIVECFLHFLPALMIDMILISRGTKPIMFKIARTFKKACKNGEFFALHEWKYQCDNMVKLNQEILRHSDKVEFNIDVGKIDWDDYIKNYVMGLRKYVLKDADNTLGSARKKLKRLYWGTKIFRVCAVFVLWKMLDLRWIASPFVNLFP